MQVFFSDYAFGIVPNIAKLPPWKALLQFHNGIEVFVCVIGPASVCQMAQNGRVFGDLSIDCLSPPSGNNPLQIVLELLMPHSHLYSDTVFPVLLQHITLIDRRHSGVSIFMAAWGTFMQREKKKEKKERALCSAVCLLDPVRMKVVWFRKSYHILHGVG